MNFKKQLLYTFAALLLSQLLGQILPPFSLAFGTPAAVPVSALLINYVYADDRNRRFSFELKALIVIAVSVLSGVLDYYFAPGTHDQVGFAWMSIMWLAGLFIICVGLTIIKFIYYIRFSELGANLKTLVHFAEIILLWAAPVAIAVIALTHYI